MRELALRLVRVRTWLCFFALAGAALAQCPVGDATPPINPLNYPKTSDRYAVEYKVGAGPWTSAPVYISYYGETTASPPRSDSGYSVGATSLSFVSIPVDSNQVVRLRVKKLFDGPFQPDDHVSVRPSIKFIDVDRLRDGAALITTTTPANFAGEQFLLWWNRGSDGGGVEGLAFYLNPPYAEPTGSNVKVVNSAADLTGDLTGIDTLDFETTVDISAGGTMAYEVRSTVLNIFLGPTAWVKGKLRFDLASTDANGVRLQRKIYGPGVLDVSLFNYENRACKGTPDEYYALSSNDSGDLNRYTIDGIILTDINHAANDIFFNSVVNNMKVLGWNGENAALRLGDNTVATNVFIRSGDDSLMMWGSPASVSNATVWQNYNGGVANLGWSFNVVGDGNSIDGLYVVKTDWLIPTTTNWTARNPNDHPLQGQNNAVFASLMVPTTSYGYNSPPVYKNIFIEDPPQVLFSIKILPPICAPTVLTCPVVDVTQPSFLSLIIENLVSPPSIVPNSIGFQNVPDNYAGDGQPGFTLQGTMKIGLTNIFAKLDGGFLVPILNFDTPLIGTVQTNGNVDVTYGLGPPK
jgi:hypothetical protein